MEGNAFRQSDIRKFFSEFRNNFRIEVLRNSHVTLACDGIIDIDGNYRELIEKALKRRIVLNPQARKCIMEIAAFGIIST